MEKPWNKILVKLKSYKPLSELRQMKLCVQAHEIPSLLWRILEYLSFSKNIAS